VVSTTPVVEQSRGRVEDSTTNPVVKSPTIPLMECSTTAAVVKSTAGQVEGGPQKLANAEVKRHKKQKKQEKMTTGGPQSQEEVAGVQFTMQKKKKKSKNTESPAVVSTTPVVEQSTGRVEDSTTNPVVKSPTIPLMECSITAAVVKSTAGQVEGGPQKLAKAQVKRQKKEKKQEKMTTGGPQSQEEVAGVQFRREKKKKKKSKKMHSPAVVSTTPVVEHSTGMVADSTTNPVVKSSTIPVMECSTYAAVVKSTAGLVGPQEKMARVEVTRGKANKKKTTVACEDEVPGVVMAELVEIAGAGDEVAATHHTLTRRCSSAGDIRSVSPHQSPYQSSKLHRTSSYESLTTPVRPGAARKTATADTRCLFTGGLSVTEMRERAQVYTVHTYIHTHTRVHTLDLCMSCTYDIQTQ